MTTIASSPTFNKHVDETMPHSNEVPPPLMSPSTAIEILDSWKHVYDWNSAEIVDFFEDLHLPEAIKSDAKLLLEKARHLKHLQANFDRLYPEAASEQWTFRNKKMTLEDMGMDIGSSMLQKSKVNLDTFCTDYLKNLDKREDTKEENEEEDEKEDEKEEDVNMDVDDEEDELEEETEEDSKDEAKVNADSKKKYREEEEDNGNTTEMEVESSDEEDKEETEEKEEKEEKEEEEKEGEQKKKKSNGKGKEVKSPEAKRLYAILMQFIPLWFMRKQCAEMLQSPYWINFTLKSILSDKNGLQKRWTAKYKLRPVPPRRHYHALDEVLDYWNGISNYSSKQISRFFSTLELHEGIKNDARALLETACNLGRIQGSLHNMETQQWRYSNGYYLTFEELIHDANMKMRQLPGMTIEMFCKEYLRNFHPAQDLNQLYRLLILYFSFLHERKKCEELIDHTYWIKFTLQEIMTNKKGLRCAWGSWNNGN